MKTKKETIIIDFETNGFEGSSVLSIAAIKSNGERFERFYFPVEEYKESAIKINGLTKEVVEAKRGDATYAKHFSEDKDIIEFFSDVSTLVAHNIGFDYTFLPAEIKSMNLNIFCTMKSLTHMFTKNMGLKDTAEYFEISFDEEAAHGATYDAEICEKIFNKIEAPVFNSEYLTKVFCGKNSDGEFLIPFGSLKGKTAEELTVEERASFLSKFKSAAEHQMYAEIAALELAAA